MTALRTSLALPLHPRGLQMMVAMAVVMVLTSFPVVREVTRSQAALETTLLMAEPIRIPLIMEILRLASPLIWMLG